MYPVRSNGQVPGAWIGTQGQNFAVDPMNFAALANLKNGLLYPTHGVGIVCFVQVQNSHYMLSAWR